MPTITQRKRAPSTTASKDKVLLWVCKTCQQPIKGKSGYIELVNLDPEVGRVGGFPAKPSETEEETTARLFPEKVGEKIRIWKLSEIHRFEPIRRIGIHIHHYACRKETGGYGFGVEQARTLESWCAWAVHLAEKRWMGRDDLADVHRFIAARRDMLSLAKTAPVAEQEGR